MPLPLPLPLRGGWFLARLILAWLPHSAHKKALRNRLPFHSSDGWLIRAKVYAAAAALTLPGMDYSGNIIRKGYLNYWSLGALASAGDRCYDPWRCIVKWGYVWLKYMRSHKHCISWDRVSVWKVLIIQKLLLPLVLYAIVFHFLRTIRDSYISRSQL